MHRSLCLSLPLCRRLFCCRARCAPVYVLQSVDCSSLAVGSTVVVANNTKFTGCELAYTLSAVSRCPALWTLHDNALLRILACNEHWQPYAEPLVYRNALSCILASVML